MLSSREILETQDTPWSFTIVFDEEKAARNGYNVDALYDNVGRKVEPMGNVRTARGTWQARDRKNQFGAQCRALSALVDLKWVMENIKSLIAYEDEAPEGYDYLQALRQISPDLIPLWR